MFVSCDTLDLADAKALSERIDRAALARGSTAARMGAFIAEAAGEHLGLRAVADATRDRLAGLSARSATLVLCGEPRIQALRKIRAEDCYCVE